MSEQDIQKELKAALEEQEDFPDPSEIDFESEYRRQQHKPDLGATLEALVSDQKGQPGTTIFYGLSDLAEDDLRHLHPVWGELPPAYRRRVMRSLIEASEAVIELDYRTIGLYGLQDDDPAVREAAIEVLWEDNSLELMSYLVAMADRDPVANVRAAALIALGRFILGGELGDLPQEETVAAQQIAIDLLTTEREDVTVRRRALEAISNCSHPIVPEAIKEAYRSQDSQMRASAVYAMGRSYDPARWANAVLDEMDSDDPQIRYEAAKASGELEIGDAVPKLAQLAMEQDREIQEVSVWSLGEIGGKEAMRLLNLLAEKAEDEDDDELLKAIEEAVATAALMSDDLPGLWDD